MNELHRALRIILNSEVLTGGGNAKDSLKKNKGAYGIIDISMDNEKAYTTKRMLFSDYSIYIGTFFSLTLLLQYFNLFFIVFSQSRPRTASLAGTSTPTWP